MGTFVSGPEYVLTADEMIAGYRRGVFPMPDGFGGMAWWRPDERAILPLTALRVSRSLAKSCRRYRVSVDREFDEVLSACADPSRDGAWINGQLSHVYRELYARGLAHSVEVWDRDGELAGGLFGVAIGGLFAGESMFHHRRDASKVALVGLVDILRTAPARRRHPRILDCQWLTPHLATLGAMAVPRRAYEALLRRSLGLPAPEFHHVPPGAVAHFLHAD